MKLEMRELANMKDEVTEGVCDKIDDKLDKHMRVFTAATEEMRARVRSIERDTAQIKEVGREYDVTPSQSKPTEDPAHRASEASRVVSPDNSGKNTGQHTHQQAEAEAPGRVNNVAGGTPGGPQMCAAPYCQQPTTHTFGAQVPQWSSRTKVASEGHTKSN